MTAAARTMASFRQRDGGAGQATTTSGTTSSSTAADQRGQVTAAPARAPPTSTATAAAAASSSSTTSGAARHPAIQSRTYGGGGGKDGDVAPAVGPPERGENGSSAQQRPSGRGSKEGGMGTDGDDGRVHGVSWRPAPRGGGGGSMVRGGGAAAALGTTSSTLPPTGGARKKQQQQQQQQPQPMQIEPSQSQQQSQPQPKAPEVRQPPQYQYHPTPAAAAEAAAAATEKTGMPPHLRSKRPTQRRVVVASPLTPINPNQRPTANSLFSRSSSSSSSSMEKKKGSVATSTSLLARTRPRRDSVSLSSSTSTSRARFTQQQLLQSRDESSAGTCSEATSSSIDTRTSTGSDAAEKIVSVGIVPCEACSDRGDGRTSIPMCQECERANLGLLLHASACRSGGACTVVHCGDMKMRLQHMETCDTGFAGGCRACRYVFPLLRLHALQCPRDDCTLPSCASLKSCANCNGNSIHLATRDGEESRPSLCETCQAVLPPALLHSANCTDSGTCGFPRCDQMSAHIAHWMACPDGLSCRVCRRYTAIVRGHAIDCTDPKCGVSSCGAAKASLFRASLFRASI